MGTAVEGPSLAGRVLALAIRPIAIFFGITITGYGLIVLSPNGGNIGSYPGWLGDFLPLDPGMPDAIEATAQLVIAASVVAILLGGLLGVLARASAIGPVVTWAFVPIASLAGVILAPFLIYWLSVRFDVLPAFGFESLAEDPVEALRRLVLPGLAVGVPMAPAVASLIARGGLYTEPYGMAVGGAGLASRAEPREGWRFGYPAGLLVLGLVTVELAMARPGVARVFLDGFLRFELARALDALAILALGGAVLSLIVDLVGLRPDLTTTPTAAGLRLAGYSTRPPSRLLLGIAIGAVALVALVALAGRFTSPLDFDPRAPLAGPFTDGHLFGTDSLGRDVLDLALAGLGPTLLAALLSALCATAVGAGLALVHRALGSAGHVVPGAIVDALWWPVPLLVLLVSFVITDADGPLHPAIVVAVAVALLPTAMRMVQREPISLDDGGMLRVVGAWFLLSAIAFANYLVIGFIGLRGGAEPALGAQMSFGFQTLTVTAWPIAVPSVVAFLAMSALNSLGASLIHFGWFRTAQRLTDELDDEIVEAPVRVPGQPVLAEAPVDLVVAQADFDDGGPLAPNYALQPGLPRPDVTAGAADEAVEETVNMADLPTIPPPT